MSMYVRIASDEELIDLYHYAQENNKIIEYLAGGTDILVEEHKAKQNLRLSKKTEPVCDCILADISGWDELKVIDCCDNALSIGALCTHDTLSKKVPTWASPLAEAAGSVGSQQIRNLGTIGGNSANGAAAADTPTALALYDTEVKLVLYPNGETVTIPYRDYLKKREELAPSLIKEFHIHNSNKNIIRAYYKSGRRNALAISLVTTAMYADCCREGEQVIIDDLTISTGAVTASPYVHTCKKISVEDNQDCMNVAGTIASEILVGMNEQFGPRASRNYKIEVVKSMIYRFLTEKVIKIENN